jgi:putative tryptophan/tyrosine transport system substrate-binding protein
LDRPQFLALQNQMKRRDFLLASAIAIWRPSVARAQAKMPIVGLLWNDSVKPSPLIGMFLDALRERGWSEGRNFRLDDRVSLEGYTGYAENVAALVQAKADVIVAFGSTAVFAAAKATKEIPIVMNAGVDPVAAGLVASMARPGGNITGIVNSATVVSAKRIQLLKEMNPGLSSFGVVLTPNVGNPIFVRDSEAAARALNLQVHFGEATKPEEVDRVLGELAKKGAAAVYVAPSSMLQAHSARVVDAVARHRLPAVYGADRYLNTGALIVYSSSTKKSFMRAAAYVDRVLKGARPAEMAIEQISEVDLTVNLKTAKTLGITIPASILVRADRVIE